MPGRTSRWGAFAALAIAAACTDAAPTSPSVNAARPLFNLTDPAASAIRSFCNTAVIRVPALSSTSGSGAADVFPSTVEVTDVAAGDFKVTATIKALTHSFTRDIDMLLVGPTGVAVMLMSDVGDSDDNFMSSTLTFDDDATDFIRPNPTTVIPSGTYRPTYLGTGDGMPAPAPAEPYNALLSAFAGTSPNGTWKLFVYDDATDDVGQIVEGWCVNISSSNAAPVADAGGPYAADEASPITFNGAGSSDEDGEIVSYAWDFGDGATASGPSPEHTYADNGTYPVTLIVTDNAGATSQVTTTATVTNVAPQVSQITLPANPVAVGAPIIIGASFSDVGTADTHTATFDLGNGGGAASGIVVESNGSGSATATVTYTQPGVYTIRASVTDDDGGTGTRSSALDLPAYVVVYDPLAGFVTGGGWITSPPGAYTANPSLTGRATFGFVAKAVSGTAPLGKTKFHLQVGSLDFSSTRYEWLVVANMKSRFKGTGTVNGAGGYGFLLTAVDGGSEGGIGDRLRVKIWNLASGSVVYDSDMGALEDFTATTPLAGGSIVVHR